MKLLMIICKKDELYKRKRQITRTTKTGLDMSKYLFLIIIMITGCYEDPIKYETDLTHYPCGGNPVLYEDITGFNMTSYESTSITFYTKEGDFKRISGDYTKTEYRSKPK